MRHELAESIEHFRRLALCNTLLESVLSQGDLVGFRNENAVEEDASTTF
jgi:hypothetical protein